MGACMPSVTRLPISAHAHSPEIFGAVIVAIAHAFTVNAYP